TRSPPTSREGPAWRRRTGGGTTTTRRPATARASLLAAPTPDRVAHLRTSRPVRRTDSAHREAACWRSHPLVIAGHLPGVAARSAWPAAAAPVAAPSAAQRHA